MIFPNVQKLFFLPLLGLTLLFAACDSVPQTIKQRFTGVPPQTHVIAGEPRAAYDLALSALKKMNFHYVRGGPAQGELEAINDISSEAAANRSRQTKVSIRFSATDPKNTLISVLFTDINQEDPSNPRSLATEQPLDGGGLYNALFSQIDREIRPE